MILLDVVMPKMHGIDVCKDLKADENLCRIPVIFVTSMDESANEEAGFAAGACDYITKPLRPEIVRARIRIHLYNQLCAEFLESLVSDEEKQLEEFRADAKKLEQMRR